VKVAILRRSDFVQQNAANTKTNTLPLVKKTKTIALKASKKKARVSSEEDFDNEEDAVAMLAKNFGRLMKNDKFKKKFTKRLKKALRESVPEEAEKKDPRGPRCLNTRALGIFGLIVGISSRVKGRPIMRL
jgi:protein tyrosine/serine phosphatase